MQAAGLSNGRKQEQPRLLFLLRQMNLSLAREIPPFFLLS
ncbi:hypothetical protein AERO9A_320020 [Aeromonas salmonicida]|nr:hypothetical protein AERO9A_320020 [Aeromonas salmonicida]